VTDRRKALKVIAGCAGTAAVAAGAVPAIALVAEPGQSAGAGPHPWIRVARLDALELGHPTKANVIGAKVDAWERAPDERLGAVWLIRDSETAVRAYSVVCPHSGCAIDLTDGRFYCPCHDSYWNVRGHRESGPSPRDMDPIDVHLAEGWVLVRYERFRLGVSERTPA
jgi:Rieske Fe-S protein